MRIAFDDRGRNFVEISKSEADPDKISVILSSQDPANNLKTIVNSAELTKEQFHELTHEFVDFYEAAVINQKERDERKEGRNE
jgi:hypothetical protein